MTRIIAGVAKGRRLRTPATDDTRPTTDRVREAAFSAIADWAGAGGESADQMLSGLSFLDLYAGSGAVGLEAASRGASPVTAVESAARVAEVARDNARTTGLAMTVAAAEVVAWLTRSATRGFDVVWADPPYAVSNAECEEMMKLLLERGWLNRDGLLVLERSSRDDPPQFPSAMTQQWSRRYGETLLYFAMKD